MLKLSWATVQCYTYSSLISAAFLFRSFWNVQELEAEEEEEQAGFGTDSFCWAQMIPGLSDVPPPLPS